MLLGRDVAQHGRAVPSDHGRPDGRGDVVVARRDVGHQRAQRVEGRFVAELFFLVHLLLIWSSGMWPGPSIMTCTSYSQAFLVSSPRVLSSANWASSLASAMTAGPQAVAQRKADIVLLKDLADVVEVLVQEVLLVMLDHPLGQNRPAAADDSGDALA